LSTAIASVNAGPRLDRLATSPLHRRVFWLVGAGMFFDGFDIYVSATVLGILLKTGFSTFGMNALFVSLTFLGTMVGSIVTGFLGDRYGRRFTYQANLLIFGLAALCAAFAPSMAWLVVMRFVMGIGLGAENVVGYSTMTEFAPARARGKWLALIAVFVVSGLPATALLGSWIIPAFGWRPMFVIGGLGALVIWYLRKQLPESPRWLESVGRTAEAERIVTSFEESSKTVAPLAPVPPAPAIAKVSFSALFQPPLLSRTIVALVALFTINAWLYGFVTWVPTFFVKEGLSIATSFWFALLMSFGAPIGAAIGAFTADSLGRKPTIITASLLTIVFAAIYPFVHDPVLLPLVGFLLTVPIYVLVALLFGVYVPELFPTEVRLRASGITNMFGRGAAVVVPPIVVALFNANGVGGVLAFMIALTVVQIVVVAALGIEPRARGLEQIDPVAVRRATDPLAEPAGA
jgi:MFS transporter, putative metabolite:H+ symporter